MFDNQKPQWPRVFKEIIETDKAIDKFRNMSIIPFAARKEFKKLLELRKDLTRAAEQILHWNTDKGNFLDK